MADRLVLLELGRTTIASPDGCAVCGWPERGHEVWYVDPHLAPGVPQTYVRPDDRTRLARMRARRALRLLRDASKVNWLDRVITVTSPSSTGGAS